MNLKFPSYSQELLNQETKTVNTISNQEMCVPREELCLVSGIHAPGWISGEPEEIYSCKMQKEANCYNPWDVPV